MPVTLLLSWCSGRLGTDTHLAVRKHAPLRNFDPVISETLSELMQGMVSRTHTTPVSVEKVSDSEVQVTIMVPPSPWCLIWAIGRTATDTINLEAAGVETDKRGYIKVDEFQIPARKTSMRLETTLVWLRGSG